MKINDSITGVIILAISIFVFFHSGTFKTMPGVPYGPSLFPKIIAVMMGFGAVLLIVSGIRKIGSEKLVLLEAWAKNPRSYAIFAAIVASFLLYVYFAEALGFLLISFVLLMMLMVLTRGIQRLISSSVIAICFSGIVFFLFGQVLRIPLPIGVVERFLLGYS